MGGLRNWKDLNLGGLVAIHNSGTYAGDHEDKTLFDVAAFVGHEVIARRLLDKGADPVFTNGFQRELLEQAASVGYLNLVRWLFHWRPKIWVAGLKEYKRQVLNAAIKSSRPEIVRTFLEKTHDINDVDSLGRTAIHTACAFWWANVEVARVLLETGADISIPDYEGFTPIHFAARDGNAEIATLLIENGADITAVAEKDRWTPLHYASVRDHIDIVQAILQLSSDGPGSCHTSDQESHTATNSEAIRITSSLKGVSAVAINLQDAYGRTPLFLAARFGSSEASRMLLSYQNIDVDQRDHYGSTPLFAAVANGHLEVVRLLWDRFRIELAQNFFNYDLRAWARFTGNNKLIQFMKQATPTPASTLDFPNVRGTIFSEGTWWCRVCTTCISDLSPSYCRICSVSTCQECLTLGLKCHCQTVTKSVNVHRKRHIATKVFRYFTSGRGRVVTIPNFRGEED